MELRKQFVTYMKEEEYIQKLLETPEQETKEILEKYRKEFINTNLKLLYKELEKYKKEVKEWNKEAQQRSLKLLHKLGFIRKICKKDERVVNHCLNIAIGLHFYESKLIKKSKNNKGGSQ